MALEHHPEFPEVRSRGQTMPFAAVAFDVGQHDVRAAIWSAELARCQVIEVPAVGVGVLHVGLGIHRLVTDETQPALAIELATAREQPELRHYRQPSVVCSSTPPPGFERNSERLQFGQ